MYFVIIGDGKVSATFDDGIYLEDNMKRKAKRSFAQVIALLLVFALSATFTQAYSAGMEKPQYSAASAATGLTDVTGQYDLDELKAKYYNSDVVMQNKFSKEEERWVIVELSGDSVMDEYLESGYNSEYQDFSASYIGKKKAADMRVSHRKFLGALDRKGIDYEYKYSYTSLNNGVAIKVKLKDVPELRKIKNVEGVYYSEQYAEPETVAVSNNANVYTTGIYDSSDIEYKGDGMVVAILDSGLDFSHPAFSHMPDGADIWTKEYVAEKFAGTMAKTSLAPETTVDQVYYNAKVPYAFDYADDDPDVYPSYSSHGTHVAGIVAGRDDTKVVNASTGETFIGVAPNAQLAIMKVFTDDPDSKMLGGADTIDILAALNDCAAIGVDVINMSLGSSAGFSTEEDDEYLTGIYNKVEEAGISLVVAASNDYSSGFGGGNGTNLATNPDSGTVGSPSTYSAALSVASINGQKSPYILANKTETDDGTVAFITEASDANGNELDFVKGIYEAAAEAGVSADADGSLTLNYVLVGGVGRPSNYTSTVRRALSDGKTLALVKRGDITFQEKVENAMANGAIGVIIYNNLSGTIRMSLGEVENPVPTCSIGMDAGKQMEAAASAGATRGVGTVTFSADYEAGPFMSDFSSWGPTPDLKLKPEITAHGGEITSAVPGGYDEYSGTSMAAPNMAGAVALLRQHVEETYGLSGKALRARVNQLLMSTATMALNEEGNPYSPRKQGAGLAGIKEAIETDGYITVKDAAGNDLDKTKLELGDDKAKKGEYSMKFTVHNVSDAETSYKPKAYVMTETLASDLKTVAEKAHMLSDSEAVVKADGVVVGKDEEIKVPGNGSVEIEVTVKLGAAGREYIENSFANGMYVEGFIRLDKVNASENLGIPFLAFYGDWTDAPLFDYSMYEIAEDDQNTEDEEDKIKASASETRPLGLYYDDQYIIPLGSYLYNMSDFDTEIYASDDKAAVSIYDETSRRTIYEMYMVYAGLLRGAKTMDVNITDASTGELVYSKKEYNVRKSYAAGGANVGSPVMLEIDPLYWGFNNNSTYTVTMDGSLDYEGGEHPERSSFSFDFTIDYEAPVIRDYRIRFEPYTENKETKYRIYMDVDVYDNQYAQALLPCYVKSTKNGNYLTLLTEFPVPIYSQKGSLTTVSFEVTDFYDEYVTTGNLFIGVEDYAMNQTLYQVHSAGAVTYPDSLEFATDDKLEFKETVTETVYGESVTYNVYELSLAPNEAYKVAMTALPDTTAATKLTWKIDKSHIKAQENEIFASSKGTATATLYAGEADAENILGKIIVTVEGDAKSKPMPESVKIEPVLNGSGYLSTLDSGLLELNPNMTIDLGAITSVEPWYCTGVRFTYATTNPAVVSVSGGKITTHKKGTAYVTVTAVGYERVTKSIKITVGSDFNITNYYLYDYYGGPEVVIPDDLNVMYLDDEAFKNNTTITSVVLPKTLTEIPEEAFMGCTNLKRVVIPSECTVIGERAFSGCVSLETLVLEKFTDKVNNAQSTGALTVGKYAFENCRSLKNIENQQRITTAYDYAFTGCVGLESIDLSGLRVGGEYVFNNCTSLSDVTTDENTYIGPYMFKGCTSLAEFEIKSSRVNDGAFYGCTNLASVTFSADEVYYIGGYAFYGAAVSEITLPGGNYPIGEYAFGACKNLETVNLSADTVFDKSKLSPFDGCDKLTAFTVPAEHTLYTDDNGILYNKTKTVLELVPYGFTGSVTVPAGVTAIGDGAFAGIKNLESIDLSGIVSVGAYAFAGSGLTSVVIPSGTSVCEGAFYSCTELASVTADNLTIISDYTFYGCTSLLSVNLPKATEIGANAFSVSGVTSITAPELVKIGSGAFRNAALVNAVFPQAAVVGDYAFANNKSLTSVSLGGVTEMGERVFFDCAKLSSVIFGEGTTTIGDYAFWSDAKRAALTSVSLPDTLESVGAYAFFNASALTTLNISGAKHIGDFAFFGCEKLDGLDLSNVETVGAAAFAGAAALKEADLSSAVSIGASAFAGSGLTSLKLDSAEKIGAYAFEGTRLTTVTIPATLDELTFDDSWVRIGDNGKPETVTGKKTARYGIGAFANIPTLTTINVAAGNPVFVSYDGVLYSKAADGLRLEQYPAGKTDASYSVRGGTVRIGDSAFEGVSKLKDIEFPYTVNTIGAYAFFDSSVTGYTFESVEAPSLETAYVDPAYVDDAVLQYVFSPTKSDSAPAHSPSVFYANFKDYVARVVEKDYLAYVIVAYEAPDFGLTITRPENGVGYDSIIWKGFFSTENLSAYAADRTTRTAIDAIGGLPAASEISAILSSSMTADEKKTAIRQVSENEIQPVRRLYNLITDPNQQALVTESDKLFEAEKAVRDVKEQLGIPAVMNALNMITKPDKTVYTEGETFDPAGMIIRAVYDDLSEVEVTGYTLDKTVLSLNDTEVKVSYGGLECTVYVDVRAKEQGGGDEPGPVDPNPPADNGLTSGQITGIVLGSVGGAALIGGAIAFIVIRRRKKQ